MGHVLHKTLWMSGYYLKRSVSAELIHAEKIDVKTVLAVFDQPVVSDAVEGDNFSAFSITSSERAWVPGGELVPVEYEVVSIERVPEVDINEFYDMEKGEYNNLINYYGLVCLDDQIL